MSEKDIANPFSMSKADIISVMVLILNFLILNGVITELGAGVLITYSVFVGAICAVACLHIILYGIVTLAYFFDPTLFSELSDHLSKGKRVKNEKYRPLPNMSVILITLVLLSTILVTGNVLVMPVAATVVLTIFCAWLLSVASCFFIKIG